MSQPLQALKVANTRRIAAAHVRRDLKARSITFAEALAHPDAGSLQVAVLLKTIPGVGKDTVATIMRVHRLGPVKRVRELTDRQIVSLSLDPRTQRMRKRNAA